MLPKTAMQKAPLPNNEDERLHILRTLDIFNKNSNGSLDSVTKTLAEKLKVPLSSISIIDKDKEIYAARYGLSEKDGPRSISFCGHALLATSIFIVEDTLKDPRFADNPYTKKNPPIRFYAGISIKHKKTGLPIAVLCVKDYKPRKLSLDEINTFIELAKEAEYKLNNLPVN